MVIFVSKFGHRSLVWSPAGISQGVLTCKSLIRELVSLCRLPSGLLLRFPGLSPPLHSSPLPSPHHDRHSWCSKHTLIRYTV